MKNAKYLKLVSVLLVFGLIISFSACGSNSEVNSSETQKTSEATITALETPAPPDPFGKYEPAIELTSLKYSVTNQTFPEGQDIHNNIYTQEIEKVLGIKVKYDWVIDMGQYDNKLNLSIASGDIPDFFLCRDSKTFINLAASGQLADLTDAFQQYASDAVKEAADYFPEGMDSAKFGGRLMALPLMVAAPFASGDVVWIRDDWMKKFNLQGPKTMDELINIAETFKANIPGSYGIAIHKELYGGLNDIVGFANAYHAYPTNWIKDASGQIVYGSIQPEMKKCLLVLQDMFKRGLIDKEYGVKDLNKVNEDLVEGKVGIEFGTNWNCYWPFPDLVKKDVNAIFKPYDIPSSDGKPVRVQAPWPVSQYFVVNKNCKYPEAAVKMANLYARFSLTIDAADYNNIGWDSGPLYWANPRGTRDINVNVTAAITAKDPSKLNVEEKGVYESCMRWLDSKDPGSYGSYYQMGSEGSLSILNKCDEEGRIFITALKGSNPPIYAEKKATLDKLELDAFTEIIMGGSIDKFDEFVNNWNSLGGDEATKEINSLYNK